MARVISAWIFNICGIVKIIKIVKTLKYSCDWFYYLGDHSIIKV